MKIRNVAWILGCAVLLSGCTKSNIVMPDETEGPDFNIYQNIVLDEVQLQEDVEAIFLDEQDYPMASEVYVDLDLDNAQVDITVVVKDGTSPETAAEYAMEVVKGANDQVVTQDFSYGESGEDTYGGLYQDNAINLKIYEASQYAAEGEPMYDRQIPMDTYQEVVIE